MAGLTFNTKKRAQPQWPAPDTSFEPYFDSGQSWATHTYCPGFNGDAAGTSIRIPQTSYTAALQYYDKDGTASTAGSWNGGLAITEVHADSDYWVGWYMDNTDQMLYIVTLDHGTEPDSLCFSKINAAGTLTQIGKTALNNASMNSLNSTTSYASPLYRKGGDGSGDFAIRFSYTQSGGSAQAAPQRGSIITIAASNAALSYADMMPSTYGSSYASIRSPIGPTANGIIGGPFYGPQVNTQAWYGSLLNQNNGKGYYQLFFEGARIPQMAGGASSFYFIRWREGYIHMNWGQHYGPVYYKEADLHNYLDEVAVFYGIL